MDPFHDFRDTVGSRVAGKRAVIFFYFLFPFIGTGFASWFVEDFVYAAVGTDRRFMYRQDWYGFETFVGDPSLLFVATFLNYAIFYILAMPVSLQVFEAFLTDHLDEDGLSFPMLLFSYPEWIIKTFVPFTLTLGLLAVVDVTRVVLAASGNIVVGFVFFTLVNYPLVFLFRYVQWFAVSRSTFGLWVPRSIGLLLRHPGVAIRLSLAVFRHTFLIILTLGIAAYWLGPRLIALETHVFRNLIQKDVTRPRNESVEQQRERREMVAELDRLPPRAIAVKWEKSLHQVLVAAEVTRLEAKGGL